MRLIYRYILILILALTLTSLGSYQLIFQQLLRHSQQLSLQHGVEFNHYLNNQLSRFSTLTDTLVQRPELKTLLAGRADNSNSTPHHLAVSQLLADFTLASGSASIYLMDTQGLVVAASNYAEPVSFMAHNFGFRPYFTETLRSQRSYVDYGLGWVSNERGFYFAATVKDSTNQLLGVLAVKLNIEQLENAYQAIAGQSQLRFMLVDEERTVIASNYEPWRLTWLGDKPVTRQRHPGVNLRPLQVKEHGNRWQLLGDPSKHPNQAREFIVAVKANEKLPWQLILLESAGPLKIQALQLTVSLCLLLLVFILTAIFWRNRRQHNKQKALVFNQLERAVTERTESLQQSNQRLQYEIQQRNEAESELQHAQEQLLQAAKLATIGQLSASINHEINQPLTAMHSYLQNAQLMQQKGMYPELATNLDKMSQLLLRLNHIVKQFKSFSRKAPNQPEPVRLRNLVQNALGILQPVIKQQQVQIQLQDDEATMVKVDPLQLEQVLVNLLGNAIQAAEQHKTPILDIRIVRQGANAILEIHDNGPGIQPHVMVHLFEPFFTTKQGSGLGLGLSISRQIVQSYHGNLQIANHPAGGAIVTLSLPHSGARVT